MPIVEIFMRRGRTPAEIQAITDTLHDALVEAYEAPRDAARRSS
jgi:phenylpyruvate tautomerase PptA (4-oxalocrotonate tautomerase family)